jgi:4-amino-4-deoxy-L-arabinose transferase-like glycosyltransferase
VRIAARDPLLLGATLVGLALRAIYSLTHALVPIGGDQIVYEQLGRNFASYWGIGSHPFYLAGTIERPPLYPLMLAINYNLGLGDKAVRVEQGALLTVACFALSVMVARTVNIRAGRLTAVVAAVLPPLITIPSTILSDTLAAVLCAFCFCFLVAAWTETAFKPFALKLGVASLIAAAGTLTHPNIVLIFVPVLVTAVFARKEWRERSLAAGAAALAALVLFLPWMIRNQHEQGTLNPLPKNEATSTQLSAGVHLPVYKAGGEFGAKNRAQYYFVGSPPGLTRAQALSRPLTYTTAGLVKWKKALLDNIKHRPLKQIDTSLFWQRELWLIAFDDHTQYGAQPAIPWLLIETLHLAALVLALIGAWFGRRLVLVRLALLIAVLVALPYLIVIPSPRYALPALLVLVTVAGVGLEAIVRLAQSQLVAPSRGEGSPSPSLK